MVRVLGPLVAETPRIDDVGMTFWAASSLANYYLKGGAPDRAVGHAQAALDLVHNAGLGDPDEPEYPRWQARALARLAEVQAATGDQAAAMANLDRSIEVLRELHDALPGAGRRRDLQDAIESALKLTEGWPMTSPAGRPRWMEVLKALA